jgi:hypothetical protein
MDDQLQIAATYESGRITMAYILGFRTSSSKLNKGLTMPGDSLVKPNSRIEQLFKRINETNLPPDESTEETARNILVVLIAGACSRILLNSNDQQDVEIEIGGKDYSQISLISAYLSKHFKFNEQEFINHAVRLIIDKFAEEGTSRILQGVYKILINNPFEDNTALIESFLTSSGISIKTEEKSKVNLGYDPKMESTTDKEIERKNELIKLLRKINPELSELMILNYSDEVVNLFSK